MNLHSGPARRRTGLRLAVLASMAGGLVAATAFTPALASPVPGTATGATTIMLGGKAYNTLQSGGCGTLVVTGANGVTTSVTSKGVKIVFPISGFESQPSDTDAFRLDHSGSVTLENDCYSITFGTVRITNFGLPNQGTEFDLSAVTKSVDDSGRQVIGTLDLTGSHVSGGGDKVRTTQMNLLTSVEGADELNELAVGSDTGPFLPGQKVGSAKSRVVFT